MSPSWLSIRRSSRRPSAPCDNHRVKWLFGLLLFATGCDVVFRIDHITAADGGGRDSARADGGDVDAAMLPEQPTFCGSTAIFDSFDDPSMVCPWGGRDNSGIGLSVHDSVLEMHLDGTQIAIAGCSTYTSPPFTAGGAFLVVPQPLLVPHAYTKLGVRSRPDALQMLDASIVSDGTSIRFIVSNNQVGQALTTPYSWWRIAQPMPGTVRAEVSMDGGLWTVLAELAVPTPQQIDVDIGAGVGALPSASGSATFATFGVCN